MSFEFILSEGLWIFYYFIKRWITMVLIKILKIILVIVTSILLLIHILRALKLNCEEII